ncbi:hypothetical protein G6F40_018248 [Rhizopus arrhizus]|nr:hypothetical protein G6F40_018248 [Rhizopus arrhizus]
MGQHRANIPLRDADGATIKGNYRVSRNVSAESGNTRAFHGENASRLSTAKPNARPAPYASTHPKPDKSAACNAPAPWLR